MRKSFDKIIQGYREFQKKYAGENESLMKILADKGQNPEIMLVACCDSRVDPAVILQCDPGELFVVRNIANIIPPYEKDGYHHGTSAALEFGIKFLKVKHLIILGHSQCGGIQNILNQGRGVTNDFINDWVSIISNSGICQSTFSDADEYSKEALKQSYNNCLSFPWIKEKLENNTLQISLWFFDIKSSKIYCYDNIEGEFKIL